MERCQVLEKSTRLVFPRHVASLRFAVATTASVEQRASDADASSLMDLGSGRAGKEVAVTMMSPTSVRMT
jgi:hypothetical protein